MPAFSFSKQKKQPSFVQLNKQVPDVGRYNVTQIKFNSKMKNSPSVSLPKAPRDTPEKKIGPGPGAYQSVNSLQTSSNKGVSMKGTHNFKIKTQGPSPGQYDPKIQFPTKKFSFSKSAQKKIVTQGPDPGSYNVNYDVLNTTSNYIFSRAQRQPWDKRSWMKNVGPGIHQVKQKLIIEQKNQFSFPKKQKFKEQQLQIKQKAVIPGPGKYDVKNPRLSHKSVKFALAAKAMSINSQAPGPGAYKIPENFESSTVSVVIGNTPKQTNYTSLVPGPGAYQTQIMTKLKSRQSSNIVFPKQQRMKSSKLTILSIGPGQYEIPSDLDISKRKKGFSIRGRVMTQKVDLTPGPQAYNPDFTKLYSSCQRSVFGKQRKLSSNMNKNPGPGYYEPKKKQFSKTFYFNKAQSSSLDLKRSQTSIGPGQYKIKPLFGQFVGKDKLPIKTETVYV